MKLLFRCAVSCVFLSILVGCSKGPVNCSDEQLLADVRELMASQVFEGTAAQLRQAGHFLKIEEPSTTAYDAGLSVTSCSAKLMLPAIGSIALSFRSPNDEHNIPLRMNALAPVEVERVRILLHEAGVDLPRSLSSMEGMYPFDAMDHPVLVELLQGLLGSQYAAFRERMQVGSGLMRNGNLLIGNGCMAHFCGAETASFALDLKTHKIVARMVIDGKTPLIFGVQNENQLPF